MTTTKKVAMGSFALVAMLALVISPALVAAATDTVDETNSNTGPRSRNRNRTTIDRRNRVEYNNRATATNVVDVEALTGDNESSRNTSAGDVASGDVGVNGVLTNELNTTVETDGDEESDDEANVTLENDTTGPRSRNRNVVEILSRNRRTYENRADATNVVTVLGDTGGNSSTRNTTAGNVDSGDVTVGLDILNTLN